MAGMFYSLQETAEKLGKTEDEVRKLAEDGSLRLFRDGSNLLFKIDEVNALLAKRLDMDLGPDLEPLEADTGAPADAQQPAAQELTEEELMLNLGEEEPKAQPEAEPTSELGLAPAESEPATTVPEEDLLAGIMEDGTAAPAQEQPQEKAEAEEDISLAAESGALASGSDITDMDTALTGEGVNVLAESGVGEETAGDSSAETVAAAGASTEASLEEIEEDVNLDSFGSGSGLLDLSLQADDTSLGGILDEIYTSEGGEEGKAAAEAGSVEDMTAEADHVTSDTTELVGASEAVMPMTAVATTSFIEVAPDKASNLLGGLLFLPLLALLYAAIVAWAALKNARVSILEPVQGLIWYIVGGAIVLSILVAGVAFASGRERKPAAPKAVKAKKEKPAKKEKAAKEAPEPEPSKKEAKPKKSFFGKKK